jgi:hemerythrin-like domain-containing protein
MSNSLLGTAAPSFDEPVEMLDACHGRIKAQLATLRRLAAWLPEYGVDQSAQEAAAAVLRYFTVAAPHHHADEEEDLFPALLLAAEAGAGAEKPQVEAVLKSILADHQRMDAARELMLPILRGLSAGEELPLPANQVEAFAHLYEQHIAMETAELLPLARRLLSPEVSEQIGRSMAERRGATFSV